MIPRGIRNCNPGNVEFDYTPWQGLAKNQRADGRFCVFTAPKWGVRCIARVLITYFDKRKAADGSPIDTAGEAIARWAPPHENPTEKYADFIRGKLGVHVGQKIDIYDYQTMKTVVEAIIKFENGSMPYDKATIDAGLRLAGIDVPVKALHKSRTMIASTAATAATVAPLVVEKVDTVKAILEPIAQSTNSEWLQYGLAALTMISLGVIIWARIEDGQKEARA